MGAVRDWGDVALLDVRLDRLRRWAPAALTQAVQRVIHARVLGPTLTGDITPIGAGPTSAVDPAAAAFPPAAGHTGNSGGHRTTPRARSRLRPWWLFKDHQPSLGVGGGKIHRRRLTQAVLATSSWRSAA